MKNSHRWSRHWVLFGFGWGLLMFVSMDLIYPLLEGSDLETSRLIGGLALWLVMGLIFGYLMKLFVSQSDQQS